MRAFSTAKRPVGLAVIYSAHSLLVIQFPARGTAPAAFGMHARQGLALPPVDGPCRANALSRSSCPDCDFALCARHRETAAGFPLS